jgi:putative addiction module killer protein
MIELRETPEFAGWLAELRDRAGRNRILDRLVRLSEGHFGDTRAIGSGVSELRFHFGPGYRIYYSQRERDGVIILLLAGGDKASQRRDIALAKILAERESE